jgi:hypothetical protein
LFVLRLLWLLVCFWLCLAYRLCLAVFGFASLAAGSSKSIRFGKSA